MVRDGRCMNRSDSSDHEDRLSRALSEALRPVDQAILNVVAEAFHDLEQQRDELHE